MLIDLRVLGFARTLPLQVDDRSAAVRLGGFIINVTSGSLLFMYGATNFGTMRVLAEDGVHGARGPECVRVPAGDDAARATIGSPPIGRRRW